MLLEQLLSVAIQLLGTGSLGISNGNTLRSADANTRTLANVWTPGTGRRTRYLVRSDDG